MKNKIKERFKALYGYDSCRAFFAPGRVNLIGEHTDYNGGHVFPCALTLGTYAVVAKRNDRKLRFHSMNFESLGVIESSLDDLVFNESAAWTNYPKGIMWAFKEKGFDIPSGLDIVYYGNIPNGSGLSSSASIEVLTGFILRALYGFDVSNIDLALIGQFSENKFNGMNCGIMDQFASAMGKKDHAIFLDTNTLEYTYVPIELQGIKIVIANTNVKHTLTSSKYNDRRRESEAALNELKKCCNISSYGDMDEDMFNLYSKNISNDINRRRAKHAVYENLRTISAVKALNSKDLNTFGRLMKESHISLDKDYEVTCKELNILAETEWAQEGVIGARMTGGGFGGCTVALVYEDCIENLIAKTGPIYYEKTGIKPDFYIVDIGDGPYEF
ncbi:MAG: galactokinase [Lachnospiraceae bacterium]|nr:galactokinase [Lachnospiraceae bacterium]